MRLTPQYLWITAAALALACSDDSVLPAGPDPAAPPDFEARVVLDTRYGGIREAERTVIRTAAEWDAFWTRLRAAGQIEPVPAPAIDFSRSIAIVAILGERDRGGHDIDIPSVQPVGDTIVATVRLTVPGPACSQLEVITTPLTIVTVSRPGVPVVFRDETQVQDC